MSPAKRDLRPPPASGAHRSGWVGWALFAVALAVRLLYWRATPDAAWPGSANYKGDAWSWLEHAWALAADRPFELGVPIRPPGMAYVLEAFWDGSRPGLWTAGLAWAALGALAVLLFYLAARRAFGVIVLPGIGRSQVCSTAFMRLLARVT